jgi:zinc protease
VRRNYANGIEKALNDPQRVGIALSEPIAMGDWRLLFQGRDNLPNITSQQVSEAAARYLRRDNRTVGRFLPEEALLRAEITPAPEAAEVLKGFKGKPSNLSAESFDPSQANIMARTERTTIGGLKVALLPKKNRGETVAVDLRLHWGNSDNLFGKEMIPAMTGAMLMRGTSQYNREQLSDAFDKLKMTGSVYHFTTTRTHLAEALRLASHVLQEANFPAAEFEQLRQQTIVGIEAGRNDPQGLAGRAMEQHFNLYPKGDVRASATIDEQIAQASSITLDQVKQFHRDFFGASQGELAIVGDFDAPAIKAVLATSFAPWKSAAAYARIATRNFDVAPLRSSIDTPDKEGGFFAARMNLDLRTDDADYPALMLANTIFGDGGLKSRLMDRIRQKDGLSYGGGSNLSAGEFDRAGAFSISAIAAPQNLKKLEVAVREELARALKDGFSAEEVAGAKSGLLQQRSNNRAQDGIVASGWSGFLYLDRTFAWSAQFEDRLKALSVAEVNAAFRKAIDPSKLSVVTAGDASKTGAPAK